MLKTDSVTCFIHLANSSCITSKSQLLHFFNNSLCGKSQSYCFVVRE
uniref:Uncharacterized protein n=1 Tax=Arundo donax TaxID=35708 RepID=A0A0A9DD56_ARUDO